MTDLLMFRFTLHATRIGVHACHAGGKAARIARDTEPPDRRDAFHPTDQLPRVLAPGINLPLERVAPVTTFHGGRSVP
jgi:hypothetical protein